MYRDLYYKDKTAVRPSNLYNENSYSGMMVFIYGHLPLSPNT